MNCKTCSESFVEDESLKCPSCFNIFHMKCASGSQLTVRSLQQVKKATCFKWLCINCVNKFDNVWCSLNTLKNSLEIIQSNNEEAFESILQKIESIENKLSSNDNEIVNEIKNLNEKTMDTYRVGPRKCQCFKTL